MKTRGAEPGEACPWCGTQMNQGAFLCPSCKASRRINAGIRGYAALLCNIVGIGFVLIASLAAANNEGGTTEILIGILVGILLSLPFFLLSWLFNLGGDKRVVYLLGRERRGLNRL